MTVGSDLSSRGARASAKPFGRTSDLYTPKPRQGELYIGRLRGAGPHTPGPIDPSVIGDASVFQMSPHAITPQGNKIANPYYAQRGDVWGDLANFGRAGQKTLSSVLARASDALSTKHAGVEEKTMQQDSPVFDLMSTDMLKRAFAAAHRQEEKHKESQAGRHKENPNHGKPQAKGHTQKAAMMPQQPTFDQQMAAYQNKQNGGVLGSIGNAIGGGAGKFLSGAGKFINGVMPKPPGGGVAGGAGGAMAAHMGTQGAPKAATLAAKMAGYLNKNAFQPMMGGQMDPAAMGGMPPGGDPAAMGMPPGAPMDPAMMGGDPAAMGMPPGGDPAAMGGMPPGGDPAAMGMPPGGDPAATGMPPEAGPPGEMALSPEIQKAIETAVQNALQGAGGGAGAGAAAGKGPNDKVMMMEMVSKVMDFAMQQARDANAKISGGGGSPEEAQPADAPADAAQQV